MGSVIERKIDWDKVTTVEDIKAILIGMDLTIHDEPDNPNHSLAGTRYLFHPLPEPADGTH